MWVLQGGLSRNKVAVGESAAGSPPNLKIPIEVDKLLGFNCKLTNKSLTKKVRTHREVERIQLLVGLIALGFRTGS